MAKLAGKICSEIRMIRDLECLELGKAFEAKSRYQLMSGNGQGITDSDID